MRTIKFAGVPFLCCILGCASEELSPDEDSQDIDSTAVSPRAVDDSFVVSTTDACGRADFVDFGPGDPRNPASNDDYIVIHDLCADGHGVIAFASLTRAGTTHGLGSKYNGNGLAGDPVFWDPFPSGNVVTGDFLEVEVCLVDGPEGTPFNCEFIIGTSVDG